MTKVECALRKHEKTVIAILGMHRSGTSLVGQMIHALGVPMGNHLIVANEYNERGYFEDSVVVKIHEELLMAFGRPWQSINSTIPLPVDWMERPETATAREKLRNHIKAELWQGSWAVKDPRMARFLPLWKGLAAELEFDLVPLLCVRSPSEVAGSLAKRDHFPLNMGELLWTIYNFEIIDSLGSSLDCVLCYEDWFRHPADNLKRLAAAIGVELTDKRCGKLASTIVDAKLRHHFSPEEKELGPNAEFYRLLHQWVIANTPPEGLATLLTIIRDSGTLFAPWHEARASSYMAEAEVARIAEQARITTSAEEYLKAYQETEQARIGALEAIKYVEQERDAVVRQADEYLKAYQTTEQARIDALELLKHVEQERDAVAVKAEEYLKAYQTTEQGRIDALELLKHVEQERDAVAAKAEEYLKAYQESECQRKRSLCHRLHSLVTFKWLMRPE